MNPENLLMLELACEHLGDLLGEVVFVGGATVELWITDQAAPEFRRTEDIDVVVEVTTRQDYYRLEERLRGLGFENDQESGVICRFRRPESKLLLDVMPTEASILGFENRWQAESFSHAVEVALPKGQRIRALAPGVSAGDEARGVRQSQQARLLRQSRLGRRRLSRRRTGAVDRGIGRVPRARASLCGGAAARALQPPRVRQRPGGRSPIQPGVPRPG
jgi:hypothetical protein